MIDLVDSIEIDLDSTEEGEWFFYQDSHFDQEIGDWIFDEPQKAKVRIRRIQSFLQEKLQNRKRIAEHVLNPKTRAMERISYFKEQSIDEARREIDDVWDYAITGLEGFKNKKTGQIIECTRENKLKLIKIPAFDRFVAHCFRILEGSEIRQKEIAEKN
uniref:Uncharacterized protein n=1 Tax=viral metagenome TaxID=1070528 RepID=A0A6M3IRH4_9ZZZZ